MSQAKANSCAVEGWAIAVCGVVVCGAVCCVWDLLSAGISGWDAFILYQLKVKASCTCAAAILQ